MGPFGARMRASAASLLSVPFWLREHRTHRRTIFFSFILFSFVKLSRFVVMSMSSLWSTEVLGCVGDIFSFSLIPCTRTYFRLSFNCSAFVFLFVILMRCLTSFIFALKLSNMVGSMPELIWISFDFRKESLDWNEKVKNGPLSTWTNDVYFSKSQIEWMDKWSCLMHDLVPS